MKNLIAGLVLGAVVTGAIGYNAYLPKVKEASYAEGFTAGNIAGVEKGIEEGVAKAKSEGMATQETASKAKADSLAKELEEKKEALRRATAKPKETKPEIENWHVEGGQLGTPIMDDAVQNATP